MAELTKEKSLTFVVVQQDIKMEEKKLLRISIKSVKTCNVSNGPTQHCTLNMFTLNKLNE